MVTNDLITRDIHKTDLLDYYRRTSEELIVKARQKFADAEYRKRASFVNQGVVGAKENLIRILEEKSKVENWAPQQLLESALTATYTSYVAMLEARNSVWPYEYMAFTRRIGELWEPFCLLCWKYPLNEHLNSFKPPLFQDVKDKLEKEINDFINKLNISKKQKSDLSLYYSKVWMLVTSGEIKLELDLHFEQNNEKFVVDFKSGFSSNEKGNTNRLLLVAGIYKILEESYRCLILVRSSEEENNNYLQILKKSGLWNVYCGDETYDQVYKFTGFPLGKWVKTINWQEDFDPKMYAYLKSNDLVQYLEW